MTTVAPPRRTQDPTHDSAHDSTGEAGRLTRRAFWMLPAFVLVYLATSVLGAAVVLPFLDLKEGDLYLFARSAAGWTFEVLFLLVVLVPPVLGVLFARRALRSGGRRASWAALASNAALVLVMVYTFVDAIRMTYWPG